MHLHASQNIYRRERTSSGSSNDSGTPIDVEEGQVSDGSTLLFIIINLPSMWHYFSWALPKKNCSPLLISHTSFVISDSICENREHGLWPWRCEPVRASPQHHAGAACADRESQGGSWICRWLIHRIWRNRQLTDHQQQDAHRRNNYSTNLANHYQFIYVSIQFICVLVTKSFFLSNNILFFSLHFSTRRKRMELLKQGWSRRLPSSLTVTR